MSKTLTPCENNSGSFTMTWKPINLTRDNPSRRHQVAFSSDVQRRNSLCNAQSGLKTDGKESARTVLRVFDKPYLPLHNNLSERDIRDYVRKRKISGSTRSEAGRACRDTFASLKKPCLKHGISFWHYFKDGLLGENKIPSLSALIQATTTCGQWEVTRLLLKPLNLMVGRARFERATIALKVRF